MYASPGVSQTCDPNTNCFKYMYTPPAQGYLNYTWCVTRWLRTFWFERIVCHAQVYDEPNCVQRHWWQSDLSPQRKLVRACFRPTVAHLMLCCSQEWYHDHPAPRLPGLLWWVVEICM